MNTYGYDSTAGTRWKYLNEYPLFADWYVFGTRTDSGLTEMDITDGHGDVLIHVPKQFCARIIAARDAFLKELETINADIRAAT